MTILSGYLFAIMVDTGIHQYSFEPGFQRQIYIAITLFFKEMDVFEHFDKRFVQYLLAFIIKIGISVADFDTEATKEIIKFLLAASVIVPATK